MEDLRWAWGEVPAHRLRERSGMTCELGAASRGACPCRRAWDHGQDPGPARVPGRRGRARPPRRAPARPRAGGRRRHVRPHDDMVLGVADPATRRVRLLEEHLPVEPDRAGREAAPRRGGDREEPRRPVPGARVRAPGRPSARPACRVAPSSGRHGSRPGRAIARRRSNAPRPPGPRWGSPRSRPRGPRPAGRRPGRVPRPPRRRPCRIGGPSGGARRRRRTGAGGESAAGTGRRPPTPRPRAGRRPRAAARSTRAGFARRRSRRGCAARARPA